jgi:DNA-binding response OmpR family regulator
MKQKIILIEDELFINDLYRITLEKDGYSVVSAMDGEKGLQVVQENTDAALVLLDIMLPKMHGIDVLKKIKSDEKTKNMTVILLSNLGEENIISNALKDGARDYLKKVIIDPKQLTVCVESYLKDPSYKFVYDK